MKRLFFLSLFFIVYIDSFCQSHIYDGFLFKADTYQMQRFTFPLKISMVGDGKYEIFTNPSQYTNSKLQYNVEYIEYDEWERLYKYRGIRKWYSGGAKRSDNFEYTTETFITCRKKLSDYTNGLKIYADDINEDYIINIKEVTSSKWSREEIHYYTLIPFNLKEEKIISSTTQNITSSSNTNNSGSYRLEGRSLISSPVPNYPGNNEGIVIVEITVDRNGVVTKADSGVTGSTTSSPELIDAAKRAALKARFNIDNNAIENQIGNITYRFVLD